MRRSFVPLALAALMLASGPGLQAKVRTPKPAASKKAPKIAKVKPAKAKAKSTKRPKVAKVKPHKSNAKSSKKAAKAAKKAHARASRS